MSLRVPIVIVGRAHSRRSLTAEPGQTRRQAHDYLKRVPLRVTCGRRPGKDILTLVQHWSGAVTCPASHEGFSVKSRVRVQVGALLLQAFRCKPHIRQDDVPPLSFIRTKELQAGGTTLFERRLSAKPDNGAAPLNL